MRKYSHSMIICSLMAVLCLSLAGSQVSAAPLSATPVGTAFTYQGQLKDGSGNPVTATCDFLFYLYDAPTSGILLIGPPAIRNVSVANGYFTVNLDFGPGAFAGDARWLEIAVRCPAGGGDFTTLAPRQPLTPAPYSLYALNAGTAANATNATNATNAANAALLNGFPSSTFQRHYQNLLVVAKSGGDYTTISAALASITTASDTNRFLIYVAPGTYTETVTMKQYVDIEGAGELATKITQTGSASATGTVIGANNAELRFLTVENTGGASDAYAFAIYNSGASPRLTHITATASGATSQNIGVYNTTSSSPAMTNVTATASGGATNNYGVVNYNHSSPTMANVTATASGAGAGGYYGVLNTISSSPTMTNVTATASGGPGSDTNGVQNQNLSSPTMTNVTATASGGGANRGVYNDGSSPAMTKVTATASGLSGDLEYGVYNHACVSTIQDSVIVASGENGIGLWNEGSSAVKVNNSRISAALYTITSDQVSTTKVGASQLGGGGYALGGTLICVFSYGDDFVALSGSCQ